MLNGYCVDVNKQDKKGQTALHKAVSGKFDVVYAVITLLVTCNPDVNKQDKNGNTALHIAAKNGLSVIVAYLLDSGAQIIQNNKGKTAFDYAFDLESSDEEESDDSESSQSDTPEIAHASSDDEVDILTVD